MSLLLFYLTVFSLEHVGPRSHRAAPCYTPAIFIFCLDQALSELFFLPKTDDLLDGTVKNTGRSDRIGVSGGVYVADYQITKGAV